MSTSDLPMQSELLCFVADKCQCMALDDIVKICSDFYKWDEVVAARVLLNRCLPDERLSKRKGADRVRASLEDIVKLMLTPTVKFPVFYAVDISRLPPVDVVHCDVAAILKELTLLRQEVRAVAQLREEVAELRGLLDKRGITSATVSAATSTSVGCLTVNDCVIDGSNGIASFADKAKDLADAGLTKPIKTRKTIAPTVGTLAGNDKLKSVATSRVVDLFITRLHPSTSRAELEDCIMSASTADQPVNIIQLDCNKLKSRFEALYSSYHVAVRVGATDLKQAVDLFMSPQVWPVGILVRRYFKPRNGSRQQTDN